MQITEKRGRQEKIYKAPFSSQTQGVMTLTHESVPFQVKNIKNDKLGRYLIIQGTHLTENLKLMNVYRPIIDLTNFYVDLILTQELIGV